MKKSTSTSDRRIDSIDPGSLPNHGSATYPAYGSGHIRPLMALARKIGDFEVNLTTFKEGMPVLCEYIVKNKSYGWFKGIIHRTYGNRADIDYDDGDYDYNVSFQNLRHLGVPNKRKFTVDPLPAPEAIVLSIPHALEAIAHADRLVQRITYELQRSDVSTLPLSAYSSDDEIEFIKQGFSSTRGTSDRPIIL